MDPCPKEAAGLQQNDTGRSEDGEEFESVVSDPSVAATFSFCQVRNCSLGQVTGTAGTFSMGRLASGTP